MTAYPSNVGENYIWQATTTGPFRETLYKAVKGSIVATSASILTTNAQSIATDTIQTAYDPLTNRILYIVPRISTRKTTRPSRLAAYDVATGKVSTVATAAEGEEYQGVVTDAAGNIYVGQEGGSPYALTVILIPGGRGAQTTIGTLISTSEFQAIDISAVHWSFDNLSNRLIFSSPLVVGGAARIAAFDPVTGKVSTLLTAPSKIELDYPLFATK
jgi:hypothetical protein